MRRSKEEEIMGVLNTYREMARPVMYSEKLDNPEYSKFAVVTEDYGFLWSIEGDNVGRVQEDFFGCEEFYRELSSIKDVENWYKKWTDTVLEVEENGLVMVTDREVGKYLDEVSEIEGEYEEYFERSSEELSFLHRYLDS